jgi:hypothetical protein
MFIFIKKKFFNGDFSHLIKKCWNQNENLRFFPMGIVRVVRKSLAILLLASVQFHIIKLHHRETNLQKKTHFQTVKKKNF